MRYQKKNLLIILFFCGLRDASIECPLNTRKRMYAKRDGPCLIQVRSEDTRPYDRVNPSHIVDTGIINLLFTTFN